MYQIEVGISRTMRSWLKYAPNFFSVKTAPIQKPIHLLISMQFEFCMKEIIILYQHYFNWQQYLTNTNFPSSQVLNVWLRKHYINNLYINILKFILIYSQKVCYTDYKIFCKLSFFHNIRLDRNKAISIFITHSWISKIKHS